jgi:uncharacterized repeat protein (TIGR03803 family)
VYVLPLSDKTVSVLHNFAGGSDGANPAGYIVLNFETGSTLYGTTVNGGAYGQGTLFEVDISTGAEMVLHGFGAPGDGQSPNGVALYSPAAGVLTLYGSTTFGGAHGWGTVFSFNLTTGQYTLRYSFTDGPDGAEPESNLLMGYPVTSLYGTAANAGGTGHGTLWQLSTAGVLTVLHTFCESEGCPDGSSPGRVLFPDSDDTTSLVGIASEGGANGGGVLFRYDLP